MAGLATFRQPLRHHIPAPEVLMSVPPRPTEHPRADWEVTGERRTQSARRPRSDKLGLALVAIVLVAVLVAVLLLVL